MKGRWPAVAAVLQLLLQQVAGRVVVAGQRQPGALLGGHSGPPPLDAARSPAAGTATAASNFSAPPPAVSRVAAATNASLDYGDLRCMHWTSGTCNIENCYSTRGPTECIEGKCVCQRGHCADAEGVCRPGFVGKDLGKHAIKFTRSPDPSKPYLGIDVTERGVITESHEVLARVESAARPDAQWKIVLDPDGFVKFESVARPNWVISIYENRRRRSRRRRHFFLQTDASKLKRIASEEPETPVADAKAMSQALVAISESNDLWPRLQPFIGTTPIEASFLVRQAPEGGLEIWDPMHGVSLSSTETKGWLLSDEAAQHGVAECYPESWWYTGCKGYEVVSFEPALPPGAVSYKGRVLVHAIVSADPWKVVLVVLVAIGAVTGCFFGVMYFFDT